MLKISAAQIHLLGKMALIEKLDDALCRQYPPFSELTDEERVDFVAKSLAAAEQLGLQTEQGVASYTLAAYWLGIGFETRSLHLQALLKHDLPEIRKVHAMNEWAHTILGAPDDVEAADEAMKQAFYKTDAWGR